MDFAKIGRLFYGVSIAAMGVLTMYYRDFPYMLLPPKHSWISDHAILVYLSGAFLFAAGAGIVLMKKVVPVSLGLGAVLLFIFCFYFVPYELTVSVNYLHFGDWENAAKELALAGGAFVVADWATVLAVRPLGEPGLAAGTTGRAVRATSGGLKGRVRELTGVGRFGAVLFGLTIISFGIDHFLYAKEAADYIPVWIPNHLFWMYPTGAVLLVSGIAIVVRIRVPLFAILLGSMIFTWVLILHLPKAIAEHAGGGGGELTSGFLALAYCGIAFIIGGRTKPK